MKTNLYDRIFKPKVTVLQNGHSVAKKASRTPVYLLLILAVTLLTIQITQFDLGILLRRGGQLLAVLQKIFTPDFKFAKHVWTPLLNTIQMSIVGTFIGCVLALPFSLLCASNITTSKPVLYVARLVLSILRTLPTLVLALIATLIFNLGTFAGTIAIAVFNLGMVGKMLYEHIETIDMGAYEAMEALGATKTRAFISAIMPQILPNYLSISLYGVETTVRNAAVLGYVGAGGIGLILNERLSLREYHQVGMILLMLMCAVVVIEAISRVCRKKLS